jgi:hypothetical protein
MKIKFYILGIQRNFRGHHLFELIHDSGFDVEIVWGIDAKENTFPNFRDDVKSLFFYKRSLTSGEIACTLGHRMILLRAQQDRVNFAIILEDDVQINNIEELVLSVKNFINPNPSILMLIVDRRLSLGSWFHKFSRDKFKYRRIISNPSPTSAYAINQQAIEALSSLSKDELQGLQADFPPHWLRIISFYEVINSDFWISLRKLESLIPDRLEPSQDSNFSGTNRTKIMHPEHLKASRDYSVSPHEYIAHFILRSVAWRLSQIKLNLKLEK